jgi:putative restriction endonuclease
LEEHLQKYLNAFSRLKRGNTKYGIAPHKPILLLSIIELAEKSLVVRNAIEVNADLVGTFKENWQLLVPTLHHADFTQPFYYLQNENVAGIPYWFLQAYPGCQINAHIKSVNTLAAVCAYGYFAEDLFLLLMDRQSRISLKHLLLDVYFPEYKANYLSMKQTGEGYLHDQIIDVLNEPEAQYRRVTIHTEEDMFVRSGLFKQLIPKTYNNQCSFTGMKLTSTFNYNFIDACHIVPFSYSHNDKVNNGIALCPNMHRAFDRGLVSVSNDYRILVSPHVIEDDTHPYGLKQLAGKDMLLPSNEIHHPAVDGLVWHKENVFKG